MAGLDYTRILRKLIPEPGGEDVLRLRVGIVDAINLDGTVDVVISGLVIPDLPRLRGAPMEAGDNVQLLSYRGSLLVIGAAAEQSETSSLMIRTGVAVAGPTAAASFTQAVAFGATFPAAPNVHVNLTSGAGAASAWHGRASSPNTTGFTLAGFGPSSTFSSNWQWTAVYGSSNITT